MKKSQKANLANALRALVMIAVLGSILLVAIKYAPNNHFADNGLIQDVADKYRY